MSKIDDLIAKYCPDGVEFRELQELCIPLKKGTLKTDVLREDGQYPVINSGRGWYGRYDSYNNEGNAIAIAARGEYAGFINFINERFWAGGLCYPYKSKSESVALTKYIYYALKKREQFIMNVLVARGSIPALNKSDIDACKIPIPPLSVQQEIVDILDSFTKLEAELEARRKQYNYYRDKLLSFNDKMTQVGVAWKTMSEICMYSKTRIPAANLDHDNYVGVDNLLQNCAGKMTSNYVPETGNFTCYENDDILLGNIRPYLKKIWHADRKGGTNGDVLVVRIKEEEKNKIHPRYLYQILSDNKFFDYNMQNAKGAKMPRGNKTAIMNYKIPVPSMEEQTRIVSILDKFDTLVSDISEGLPAEITARRGQYEHYRDRLLTFQEAA